MIVGSYEKYLNMACEGKLTNFDTHNIAHAMLVDATGFIMINENNRKLFKSPMLSVSNPVLQAVSMKELVNGLQSLLDMGNNKIVLYRCQYDSNSEQMLLSATYKLLSVNEPKYMSRYQLNITGLWTGTLWDTISSTVNLEGFVISLTRRSERDMEKIRMMSKPNRPVLSGDVIS